jgi:hypothetical protein
MTTSYQPRCITAVRPPLVLPTHQPPSPLPASNPRPIGLGHNHRVLPPSAAEAIRWRLQRPPFSPRLLLPLARPYLPASPAPLRPPPPSRRVHVSPALPSALPLGGRSGAGPLPAPLRRCSRLRSPGSLRWSTSTSATVATRSTSVPASSTSRTCCRGSQNLQFSLDRPIGVFTL